LLLRSRQSGASRDSASEPDGTPHSPAREACAGVGIAVHFEGVKALDGVDIELRAGEIEGLIGPNGAGKTTLVDALTGFQTPSAGRVTLCGEDVTGQRPHRLAAAGVARTFQSGRSFHDLTVFENVEVGGVGVGVGRSEARDRAREALSAVALGHRADVLARSLSSGEERRLQVARALAMRPRFLFLDEPVAGLNEVESDRLATTIVELPRLLGCGVLIIEHDMRVIMGMCERILVLDHGVAISLGSPEQVRSDPAVVTAYLGSGSDDDAP
jgi:branched-chain amino acid transport system ATP-binding protein